MARGLLPIFAGLLIASGCARYHSPVDPHWDGQDLPLHQIGERVQVRSELPEATVAAVAEEFSRTVEQAAAVLACDLPEATATMVVVRAPDGGGRRLLGIGGVAVPGPQARVVVMVRESLGDRDREVVRHEAVHWLVAQRFGVTFPDGTWLPALPRWLDEGLATAFEMGGPGTTDNPLRRAQFNRLSRPHWRAMIGLRRTLGHHRGQSFGSAGYARSWAVVSYLLRENPESLKALLQARIAWLRNRQQRRERAVHERELVAACRREFDRIVLAGRPLGAWFQQVSRHAREPE
jgi:hypothetical protein